ncbi:MAG: hypothetical protein ACXAEX_16235 [Promethearchaeota archaeon]
MEVLSSLDFCISVDGECKDIQISEYEMKMRNISNLLKIQDIMNLMEGKTFTLEMVLERIIWFYGKHISLETRKIVKPLD